MQDSFIDHLNPAWQTLMKDEFQKDYFQKLQTFVAEAYKNTTCFPPKDLIFNAFNHCLPSDVKVVIIGQDPYHGFGQANGLCFSVQEGIPIPPSLKNIFIEIKNRFKSTKSFFFYSFKFLFKLIYFSIYI